MRGLGARALRPPRLCGHCRRRGARPDAASCCGAAGHSNDCRHDARPEPAPAGSCADRWPGLPCGSAARCRADRRARRGRRTRSPRRRAGARGAADAVHVALGDVGQVEVDDVADAVDVDAAGGDVGGDQHAQGCRRGRLRARARAGSATCCRGSPRPRSPALASPRTTLSAPCLVRVNTSTRSIGSALSTSASSASLDVLSRCGSRAARSARRWSPAASPRRAPGRAAFASARRAISCGMVAEKNSVCRCFGSMATILLMSWMKPMSSMRSASSSTSTSILSRRSARWPTRSSRRPGVATSTSRPRATARICRLIGTPPIASSTLSGRMCRP